MVSSSTIDGKQLDSRPSAEAKSNFYKLRGVKKKPNNENMNVDARRNYCILNTH